MKASLRDLGIGAKLAVLACAAVAVLFAGFTLALTHTAAARASAEALDNIRDQNRGIADTIATYSSALNAEVDRSMSLFASFLPPAFSLDESATVDVQGKPAPTIKAGDRVLDMDFSIPDDFLARSGAVATVFARSGDDFIRVTTSLKKQDGSRAIGTLLDRNGPAYAPLMAGKPYLGIAALFGKQYMTKYQPVRDGTGRVIGALFVGIDVSPQYAAVRQRVLAHKIGEHGYFFALDAGNGANRGRFVVHPRADGRLPDDPQGIYKRMLDTREGSFSYDGTDPAAGDDTSRERVVSYIYLPEWNWVLGGIVARDDLVGEVVATRDRFLALGAALVVGFALLFFALSRRLVTRPLEQAARVSERFAAGDLSARLATNRRDEIGRLMNAIDGIGNGLAAIVEHVRESAEQIERGTQSIAEDSGHISARVASQAGSLEQTAASIEQLTSTVRHNADNATQAHSLVTLAAESATDGGRAVNRVVSTMGDIHQAAQRIADITSVIEGIAFQTNILALNAAVEAARAGEHGRGFAVVAAEVRALAQRSAQAVKEIESLIADSVGKVNDGYRIAEEADATMQGIVTRVGQVGAIVAEINVASGEQSGGIEQVNGAIGMIGEATQQNAQLVATAERAAAQLREQALKLADAVSVFKLR